MKCIINLNNTPIFTFLTVCILIVNTNCATSWDLGISRGQDVVFLFNNRTIAQNKLNHNITKIYSIAYDAESDNIFLSGIGKNHSKMSIFVENMNSNDTKMNKILDHVGSITKMAYDSLSHTLFWTDYFNHAIFKIYIDEKMNKSDPKIIFNSTSQFPHGVSFDLCHKRLFWTNSDGYNSTIMSSDIDGTNSSVIISENLYAPLAITVDYFTAKLYWIDDSEGIRFKIERSNLDGTNREIVVSGRNQQPVQIAVDNSRIYWIDWVHIAIWYKEKNATKNDEPVKWLSLDNYNDDDDIVPRDIFTRVNIKNVDCRMMNALKYENFSNKNEDNAHHQYVKLSGNNEDHNKTMKLKQICLNDGYFNETSEICHCLPGFYGKYCEQFPCQNYCLHGECKMTADSQVYCKCHSEYMGLRCEKHICSDYCLNGGECSIHQGEPFCRCTFSQGNRCENLYSIAEICLAHVGTSQLNGLNRSELEFERDIVNEEYNIEHYNSWTQIVIVILSTIITILTVLIIVLSYFLNKFRCRPQIKKTFIVKKTSMPSYTVNSEIPHTSCDTTIENCCNMSICETPCVELQMKNLSASLSKKDDRRSIIDNMYGNCSP